MEAVAPFLPAAGTLLLAVELVAVVYVLAYKEHATSALAWSLAILFLPGLGLALLLIFGRDRLPRRINRKAAHTARLRCSRRTRGPTDGSRPWHEIERVACALGGPPARPGNAVTLLPTGGDAFAAISRAVTEARRRILVEEYIFRNDRLGGELLSLLVERAEEGLEVRLLVDAVGTSGARTLIRRLERAGGRGAVFMPLSPFARLFAPNHRNHRKIIVCDGRVGFLGGMNVGDEYFGLGFRSRYWADTHLRIEGPAAADLETVFADDWAFAAGEVLAPATGGPAARGPAHVQVVASGPDEPVNSTREVIFTALARARRRIFVSSPYLVPDPGLRDALRNAALRGVSVILLTQGRPPENWVTYLGSRFYWEAWLAAGMRIFEYQRGILHAKAVIVDDEWATVGSANLDNRSLEINFEVQCLLDDTQAVRAIREHFEAELGHAREVRADELARRGLAPRVLEAGAHLLAPLL